MSASENKPPITPPAMPAPGTTESRTELTYKQLEDELTKNTSQMMDACKAAIAAWKKIWKRS